MQLDRTLVEIRRRSALDLLDLTVVVARRRPLTLGLAALAGVAPFAALNWWITREAEAPGLYVLLWFLEAPWATAPLTIVLGGMMFGRVPGVRAVLRGLVRGFVPMVLYHVLLRGALLVTLFLYPLVPIRLAFLNEVLLLRDTAWWRAIRRSGQLSDGRGGEFFLGWMSQIGFGAAFVASFFLGTQGILSVLIKNDFVWDRPDWSVLDSWRVQLPAWTAIAFFAAARFFSYVDRRSELEGWEVQRRLRLVAASMEEGRGW